MITVSDGTTSVTPLLVIGLQIGRESRNVVHDILGTDKPVVTMRGARTSSGTVRYLFDSYAQAVKCLDLHGTGAHVVLEDDDVTAANMVYAPTGETTLTINDETRAHWIIESGYQVVT